MFKSAAVLRLRLAFCSAFDIFRIVTITKAYAWCVANIPQTTEGKLFRNQLTSSNRSIAAKEEQHGVPLKIGGFKWQTIKTDGHCVGKLVKHCKPTYFITTRNIKRKSFQEVSCFPWQNKGISTALSSVPSKGKHPFQTCTDSFV